MLCNITTNINNTTSRPIIFSPTNLNSLTGKFNQLGYIGVRPRSNSYLTIYHLQPNFFFLFKSNSEHCPGPEFRLIPKLISWAGSKPNMQNFLKYVLTITTGYSIIMEYCPGNRRKSKTEKGKI